MLLWTVYSIHSSLLMSFKSSSLPRCTLLFLANHFILFLHWSAGLVNHVTYYIKFNLRYHIAIYQHFVLLKTIGQISKPEITFLKCYPSFVLLTSFYLINCLTWKKSNWKFLRYQFVWHTGGWYCTTSHRLTTE